MGPRRSCQSGRRPDDAGTCCRCTGVVLGRGPSVLPTPSGHDLPEQPAAFARRAYGPARRHRAYRKDDRRRRPIAHARDGDHQSAGIFSRESREFPDLAERASRMAEEIETPMVRLRRRARRLVSTSARLLTMPARKLKRRFASNESHKDEPGTTRVVNYGLAAAEQVLARARRSRARGPIPHMNHGGDGALGVAADVQIPALPRTNSARASMQSGRSHRPMHRADLQPGDAGRARTYHTDAPTVTVVIPTYNRAHVVHRAIDSVLGQTFADFELIVVDDGSTDGTEAVLSTYTDPRIRYLVQLVNRGVSAARNRGIKEARGEFVAFLDSDDEWFPEKLERQVNRFKRAPDNVGLVYCGVETVGRPSGPWIYEPAHRGDIYNKLLERNVIHTGSGAMIRRSVVGAA